MNTPHRKRQSKNRIRSNITKNKQTENRQKNDESLKYQFQKVRFFEDRVEDDKQRRKNMSCRDKFMSTFIDKDDVKNSMFIVNGRLKWHLYAMVVICTFATVTCIVSTVLVSMGLYNRYDATILNHDIIQNPNNTIQIKLDIYVSELDVNGTLFGSLDYPKNRNILEQQLSEYPIGGHMTVSSVGTYPYTIFTDFEGAPITIVIIMSGVGIGAILVAMISSICFMCVATYDKRIPLPPGWYYMDA